MRTIRHAEAGDADALAAIYAPAIVGSPISFELEPPDGREMARRLETVRVHAPWLVLEEAGRVVGFAYGARHRDRAAYQWSIDTSVYVAPEARGRGVGQALYAELLPRLRAQGFRAAHAGITLPNPASQKLHERLGFRECGVFPRVGWKLGAWHDVGWWQLELAPRIGEPVPLRPPAP